MNYEEKNETKNRQTRQTRQKKIILPQIYTNGDNPDKEWNVFFSYRNPKTGIMERFRKQTGINKHKTYEGKLEAARTLKKKWREKLLNGWSPFDNSEVVYFDPLEYQASADAYGRLKRGKQKLLFLISGYLTEHQPPKTKKKTYQSYQSKFRIFSSWLRLKKLDDIHPSSFTEDHAKDFFKYLLERRKASSSTYNQYRVLLNSFFEYAKTKRRVKKNPINVIEAFRRSRNLPLWYNEKMVQAITKHLAATEPQLLIVVKFIYYTYIRPGELRLLQLKHINFWNGTVVIPAEVSKNRKEQRVTIPDPLLDDLIELGWSKLPQDYYLFSLSQQPDIKPVGINYLSKRYSERVREIGIQEGYTLYHWKHTGAATALEQGINVESIRQQMRHYDLRITQEYLESMVAGKTSEFKTKHKKI